ncbi:MAG: protein translocase subunit SecF [Syntrophobacteraceae bacterium CG23_combo_of_CG06-09_8_20_14_all_50_8]|nr:MAG: protein translocase subunit SecF [Syntrophobacteraceae bacterium CG23_combo_of_CG06-09_8_20_14_all_50_8]
MEFIKPSININFVGNMKLAFVISIAMIVISIASVILHGGLNYGIDFAGGTLVQVKFQKGTTTEKLRFALKPINLDSSIIQQFGPQELVIRTAESTSDLKGLSVKIDEALNTAYGKGAFDVQRFEAVGPKVGKDLTNKAIMAIVFSWIGMLIYIAWRFEFRYAVGGILALIHDVIITVGALSLLNKEFTLTIVAALLTIIGYSINDTIVVCDRIRENLRKSIKKDLGEIINASINETLSRTILTAFTVFIVVLILFFLGGEVIHDFAFALLVGVFVGTYSSIFIATPIVLAWEKIKPSKMRRR